VTPTDAPPTTPPARPAPSAGLAGAAADVLAELAGPDARLRDDQLDAIDALVTHHRGSCSSRPPAGASRRSTGSPPACCASRARADPRRVAAPRAHAQPGRRRRAGRHPRRHHQLRQPRRLAEIEARSSADEVDVLLISPERLNNPASARGAAVAGGSGRAAGHRRSPLHLRLGPRLPARLPPHRRRAGRPGGRGPGAGRHRHRERARRGRRRRPDRRRHPDVAGLAGPAEPAPLGGAPGLGRRAARLAGNLGTADGPSRASCTA
jgi:hypothetical protein